MARCINIMDPQKFEEHMWQLTTNGFTIVSVIFGNELGLFDIMQNAKVPLTSFEIADIAGFKERYVREWLGGMTAAQILTIDDNDSKYSIHEGHYQIIKEYASLAHGMRTCIMRFDITKQYFKTFGPWETGIQVLNVGCGTGPYTVAFAKTFPNSNFTGLDISVKGLKLAKERAEKASISNVGFRNMDAHNLSHKMTNRYDIVLMFDTLHNLPDPYAALGEAKRVLKPGGKLMVFGEQVHSEHANNVGDMMASTGYTFSTFFCLPSSLSGKSKVGYGVCWGKEEMQKAIELFVKLEKKFEFDNLVCLNIYSN